VAAIRRTTRQKLLQARLRLQQMQSPGAVDAADGSSVLMLAGNGASQADHETGAILRVEVEEEVC
jgi:hypothetical protein